MWMLKTLKLDRLILGDKNNEKSDDLRDITKADRFLSIKNPRLEADTYRHRTGKGEALEG